MSEIVRGLDGNGDWLFGKGFNDYKAGINCVVQSIQTRLNSYLGDCFFATDAGVDWFNLLGSKQLSAIQLAVSTIILNTRNVQGINSVAVTLDLNRKLTIQYSVQALNQTIVNSLSSGATNFLLTESGSGILTESGTNIAPEQST